MRQAWNKKSPNTKRNAHRERERKEEERKSNSHTNAEDARGYRKHVCSYKPFVIATPHSFAHLRPAIHHRTAIGKKINKNSNDGQIIQGRAPSSSRHTSPNSHRQEDQHEQQRWANHSRKSTR
eukprot:CAMPEP_0198133104 /NCGR_PEP_ID=MMETSP1442-20131203/59381_1 /TAXON_ID= /ORGANISM="Craspedostauros australis, Strain CCMP3328" /LENGTH=122 /DNA_ID=CAMNT_0043794209 /DNA_START=59 /DNA_END=427 /DNA_ORIENTATION=-